MREDGLKVYRQVEEVAVVIEADERKLRTPRRRRSRGGDGDPGGMSRKMTLVKGTVPAESKVEIALIRPLHYTLAF